MSQLNKLLLKMTLLSLFFLSTIYAQSKLEKGLYVISNIGLMNNSAADAKKYLNLSSKINSADEIKKKSVQIVMGKEYLDATGQLYLIPEGDAYQIKAVFNDKSWGVLTIEDTFKKEGAKLFVEYDEIKAENQIIHRQRFRLEKTKRDYYHIRTLDGRYLKIDKNAAVLTSETPNPKTNNFYEFSEWFIAKPRNRF
ncbi:MAG: hypothetical protein K9J12_10515 [Melioribacteraceae bacterium]|nr:hypothetical protein [Melioribacteraceae bacterium]MCF8264761.1 hypothetical protein [Melioribacteraceae bacterium]